MNSLVRASATLLISLACALGVPAAQADLYAAQKAYAAGDYATAFREYKVLAELGHPLAQTNLAILYANGQGVARSDIYAYAWAMLAAEEEVASAKLVAEKLRPTLNEGSLRLAEEIRSEYSSDALQRKLIPAHGPGVQRKNCVRTASIRLRTDDYYPPKAKSASIPGRVFVEATVMPDGRARHPRIIYALPRDAGFEEAARRLVLESSFPVETVGDRGDACPFALYVQFEFENERLRQRGALASVIEETRRRADQGDPLSQLQFGLMLSGLPVLGGRQSDAQFLFIRAAQAGLPLAQYMVGVNMANLPGSPSERGKARIWLRMAADAGVTDAMVTLARLDLGADADGEARRRGKALLEQAAASGNDDARYYLAALLAASDADDVRDPDRAARLVDEIAGSHQGEPEIEEIRAAAAAVRGDFAAAMHYQERAIDLARLLRRDVTALRGREAHYREGKAWFGNLLEFR